MGSLKKFVLWLILMSGTTLGCEGPKPVSQIKPDDSNLQRFTEDQQKAVDIVAKIHLLQNWLFGHEKLGLFNFDLSQLNPYFSSVFGESCKAKNDNEVEQDLSLLMFSAHPTVEYDRENCPIKYELAKNKTFKPVPNQRMFIVHPKIEISLPKENHSSYIQRLFLTGESEQKKLETGRQSGEVIATENLKGQIVHQSKEYGIEYFSEIEYIWENNIAFLLKGRRKWIVHLNDLAVEVLETINWSRPGQAFQPEISLSVNSLPVSLDQYKEPGQFF